MNWLALAGLAGCMQDQPVSMTGTVRAAPLEAAAAVPSATLETRDFNAEVYDQAMADETGAFSVDVPGGSFFTVETGAEGFVPTSLGGVAAAGPFEAGDGRVWAMPEDDYEALFTTFSSCPRAESEGGVVAGLVLLYTESEDSSAQYTVTTATATLYASDGSTLEACYLDDEGTDGSVGFQTGASGQFAVFGVPPGPVLLHVYYAVEGVSYGPWEWPLWVPETGIAPLYPAYIEAL